MVSIGLVDYMGKIEDGVGAILSLIIGEKNYEIMYWFNRDNKYRLVIEDSFYSDNANITDIYKYEHTPELISYINNVIIKDKETVFNEFL